nr:MAG TPA: hypothetical protein [Caudoviricetes sp.]
MALSRGGGIGWSHRELFQPPLLSDKPTLKMRVPTLKMRVANTQNEC